jgi:MinD-like ATPase involved in chromosome partitioning or flagellar assembly
VTREKVNAAFSPHVSGLKFFLASEQPKDAALISRVENFEILLARLSTFGRFIVLDLGSGLPAFVQKLLPMCSEKIVVLDGTANMIYYTKLLIEDIASLKVDRKTINTILNNKIRSESKLSLKQAQEKLGHSIVSALTPAPELFLQAARAKSSVVVAQPTSVIAQQFSKIAEGIIEREQAK